MLLKDVETVVSSPMRRKQKAAKCKLLKSLLADAELDELEEMALFIADLREAKILRQANPLDPVQVLPAQIVAAILALLDPVTLCQCLRVSQRWRVAAQEERFWKQFHTHPIRYRLMNGDAEKEHIARHTNARGVTKWKDAFAEKYSLWRNWQNGRCVVRTFSGHREMISCLQFDRDRIISGSSDATIRVWDLRDDKPLGQMTFTGHSATVRCLHLQGNTLASGSNDFSIKIWNLDKTSQWLSIACRKTLIGHNNFVRCLQMNDDTLISGSYDHSLKLWSVHSGTIIRSYNSHNGAVLCLQHDSQSSNRVVSGSADNSIKLWDSRSAECAMTIMNAHENAVTCVRFDAQRIISGGVDRMIKMWDIRNGNCTNTIDWRQHEGHTGVVRCLQLDSWRFVSASDDRTVKIWNLDTAERMCTLLSHTDGVTCVEFDDHRIVSGSYDKKVKLWDFAAYSASRRRST